MSESEKFETYRTGYQAAIALWSGEGALIWSRFNAMLVAHTVILATYGFAVSNKNLHTLKIGLPIAGMFLCVLWVSLTMRGFDYFAYWILSARELEEKLKGKPEDKSSLVTTVSWGGDFADGEIVKIAVGGHVAKRQMSCLGRTLTVKRCSYLIIATFFVLYVVVLVLS